MHKTIKQYKPKLNKHIRTHIKQINKREKKKDLNKEKEARRAGTFTSKTKDHWLNFDHSSQPI